MADQHPPPPTTPTPAPMPLPSASSGGGDGESGSAVGSPRDPTTPLAAFQQPLADHHQQTVEALGDFEVDSGHSSDGDSALGSEVSSLSTAFTASNYEFRFENGRRYQSANDKYLLPNDAQEMNRLELQHMIWMELLGNRLYLAPLQKIHMTHALDVGCGTGNWTMEFAAQHPHVQVIGTDLSPIQPEYVPVNCTFYLDDATRAWAFHQRFDYVHGRMLTLGIGDWDGFVDQAYAHLQPGGFLELQEWRVPLVTPDGSLRPQHALARWTAALIAACDRLGLDVRASADHADRMRRRGFAGVVERRLGVPVGPWAKGERQKRLGWMGRRDLLEALDAISKRLFPRAGIMTDFAEIDAFLRDVRDDLFDSTIHAIVPLDVVVGQRPFDG